MPYLAAAVMILIYMYNLPLTVALVWREEGGAVGVGVLDARFALNSARKKIGKQTKGDNKRKRKKPDTETVLRLFRRMRLEYFSARLAVGTGDAAQTALLCGALRALGCVLAGAVDYGEADIRPDFSEKTFRGEVGIAFSLKLGKVLGSFAAGGEEGINISRSRA